MSCTQLFIEQLRERGFRFTPQREMVLRVMHEMSGHVTVEEVYQQVQALSSSVDISTVYRTLELLQDFGLVASVNLDDGQLRYEFIGLEHPHHHLRCRSCGSLVTVSDEQIHAFVRHLAQAYGFQVEVDQLVIPGLCSACQAREQAGEQGASLDAAPSP